MNEKFKYAPGKPGFGSKGDRGEDGQQGLSMYFSDISPTSNSAIINSRIENNLDLWNISGDPLPDGRLYVTGDMFFDTEGNAYEIDAENNTFEYKYASINIGGFFLPLGVDSSTGFERYFNSNTNPKYIIDNVYTTSGAINYSAVPENIYGIQPKDFTRIEFTNIKPGVGVYNAFTVYSSGEIVPTDNHKAIAIVYDETNNVFRIGNLDNDGLLRNTNLIFDVSSLRQKKEAGNSFSDSTPEGTILTNYEINANMLFDSNFVAAPTSFVGLFPSTSCNISWNLTDFFNDGVTPDSGDLYFYENLNYSGSFNFAANDPSARPMVFTSVPTTGNVTITNLNSTGVYNYYMKLNKNGWSRKSTPQTLFKGAITVAPTSLLVEPSGGHTISGFSVVSNGPWDVSFGAATWISNLNCTSVGSGNYDGSIFFDMSENQSTLRSASMKVSVLGGSSQTVAISQQGAISNVTLNIVPHNGTVDSFSCTDSADNFYYDVSLVGLPADTIVSLQFVHEVQGENSDPYNYIDYTSEMNFGKNASYTNSNLTGIMYESESLDISANINMINVTESDAIDVLFSNIEIHENDTGLGCHKNFIVTFGFRTYVTYVSGTPITIIGNGAYTGTYLPQS